MPTIPQHHRESTRCGASASAAVSRSNEAGATLVVLALILLTLGIAGWTALQITQTGYYSTLDLQRRIQAGYLAEAGLNHAMTLLTTREDIALEGLPYALVPDTVLGEGTYGATLENNAEDPGGSVDTDGILVISAYGWAPSQRRHRRATTWVELGIVSLSVPGAASLGSGTSVRLSGQATLSGYDKSDANRAVAGAAFESTDQKASLTRGATLVGDPDQSWATGLYAEGTTYSSDMSRLMETLILRDSAVHPTGTLRGNFGTPLRPQITVIDPDVSLSSAGLTTGTGILIIQGTLKASGHFSFSGLILIDDTGTLELTGNADLQGGLVALPTSTPREVLTLSGSSTLQYSADALAAASLITRALTVHGYRLDH